MKNAASSTLLRLIRAGQLTRRALLAPLADRGLEPGDDAILFALTDAAGILDTQLCEMTGLERPALLARLERLAARDLVERAALGSMRLPGTRLTETGVSLRDGLAEDWLRLEDRLIGDLKPRRRKALRKALNTLLDRLEE